MPEPTPEPTERPTPARRSRIPAGSPLLALLTGLIVDQGGSLLASTVLYTGYGLQLSANGLSAQQVQDTLRDLPPQSPVAVLSLLLGALCSVAGGYVCARVLRRDEYGIGSVMAALSILLGLMLGSDDEPVDMLFLLNACEVACVLLGAKYAKARNQVKEAPRGRQP